MDNKFDDIITLIQQARNNAFQSINKELINLYLTVGECVSNKIESTEWGNAIVVELAKYIVKTHPEIRCFQIKTFGE